MYEIAPIYLEMRDNAFDWEDHAVPNGAPVGFILETGYPEAAFTLAVMSDGAISLYYSNGGGSIGIGTHPGPARAAKELMRLAEAFVEALPEAHESPVPQRGDAHMYVLLNAGMRGVSGREIDFGEDRSQFSPLFHAAHQVIFEFTQLPQPQ